MASYSVKVMRREDKCDIEDDMTPLMLPEVKPGGTFSTLEGARDFVHNEIQRAKESKMEWYIKHNEPTEDAISIEENFAEATFTCESGVICWTVGFCDDDGEELVPVRLTNANPQHMEKEYGIAGVTMLVKANDVMPYYNIIIAEERYGDPASICSKLDRDEGKPFEESVAHRLICDPAVNVSVDAIDESRENAMVRYTILLRNEDHAFFHPTDGIQASSDEEFNKEMTVEADFIFEDVIVPVLKIFVSTSEAPMTMTDVMADIINAVSNGWEGINRFFSDCPARIKGFEDGFSLCGTTTTGQHIEVKVQNTAESCEMVRRSLSTIKMLRMEEWGKEAASWNEVEPHPTV